MQPKSGLGHLMFEVFKNAQLTWCFSDRASWIDYILITNFCALIII